MSGDSSDESLSLADSGSSDGASILSDGSSSPAPKKQRGAKASPAAVPAAKKAVNKKSTTQPGASKSTSAAKAKSPTPAHKAKPNVQSRPVSATATISAPEHAPCSTEQNSTGDITRGPPITTDIAAKKLMGQYLRQQNRPYSAIQIHDNLHKRIQKGTIERVLTSMCLPDGGFVCKEYGKAKIYFVDQNTLPSDYSADQLDALQEQNENLKNQVEAASAEDRQTKEALQQIRAEPADADLDQLLQEARARVAEKRERVARLSNKGTCGGAGSSSSSGKGGSGELRYKTLAATVQAHNFFRRAWQARKGQCLEVVDMLSEGLGKKTKDVMAELCLESDQDANVQLPALLPELS